MTPFPVELLASAVDVLHEVALQQPVLMWQKLQQTGLFPYLTENLDNCAEIARSGQWRTQWCIL